MELLIEGLQFVFSDPFSIALMAFGVFFGIIFGAIPGLTSNLGVTLLIPFTYAMFPLQGISLLIGVYVGGISGGLITSILLNIPGTPAAMVTTWDGHPMAKKGSPNKALAIGIFASLMGGLFSAFALILIAPRLAKLALSFGTWEYCMLGVMGLSVVVSLSGKDIIKGLIACVFGLLMSMVGTDPISGVNRLCFDQWQISSGLEVTAVMMGLFAINEIYTQINRLGDMVEIRLPKRMSFVPPIKDFNSEKGTWRTLLLSSGVGTFIGILPGIGATTASLLAYNNARQISKTPEKFGTGCVEGIVAAESANNAVCGGALIPLLTMGIPGDVITAALLGGLMLHGLQPGPVFFQSESSLVGGIMIIFFISNIVMYLMELGLMKVFVRIIQIPKHILFPIILLTCVMGIYGVNNRLYDVWVMLLFGVIGYVFSQHGVPVAPMILGFLLGPLVENNFRTAMVSFSGDIGSLFQRPVATIFLLISVVFLLLPSVLKIVKKLKAKATVN